MARTRNIILADIVVANGGTVTDPNNRNSLLLNWRDAVGGRLVYDLDGIDDYIAIPQVNLVAGDKIKFKLIRSANGGRYIWRTDGSMFFREISNDVYFAGGTLTIDGVSATSQVTLFPMDGLPHDYEFTLTGNTSLSVLGAREDTTAGIAYPIYDISITAVSGNRFYPVNDGFAVNPLIADTLGGQDGTAMNFNEARWVTL